jgi:hypothetical protein
VAPKLADVESPDRDSGNVTPELANKPQLNASRSGFGHIGLLCRGRCPHEPDRLSLVGERSSSLV